MSSMVRGLPIIRVRISPEALKALTAEARKQDTTNAALAGRILSEFLAHDAGSEARMLTARRPRPTSVNGLESPLALAKRGYNANQISARLRLPYKQVLAEIGNEVDAEVAHL